MTGDKADSASSRSSSTGNKGSRPVLNGGLLGTVSSPMSTRARTDTGTVVLTAREEGTRGYRLLALIRQVHAPGEDPYLSEGDVRRDGPRDWHRVQIR